MKLETFITYLIINERFKLVQEDMKNDIAIKSLKLKCPMWSANALKDDVYKKYLPEYIDCLVRESLKMHINS